MAIPLICDLKIQQELMFCCSYVLSCPSVTDPIQLVLYHLLTLLLNMVAALLSGDIHHEFTYIEWSVTQCPPTSVLSVGLIIKIISC